MGNFEKLSVLVIVVIIVMILVVAIYEWTGSPSDGAQPSEVVVAGAGGGLTPTPPPTPPSPFVLDPLPQPGTKPATGPLSKPGPAGKDPFDLIPKELTPPSGPDALDPKPEGLDGVKPDPAPAPKPAATEIPETTHVVVSGDTLGGISKKYYAKASLYTRILDANPGVTPEGLRLGMKLKIPALKIEPSAALAGTSKSAGPADATPSGERPVPGKEYKVKASDTWERIAKMAFNSVERWPDIYMINLKVTPGPKDLKGGLVIMIPKD